jgi:beta-lactamase class A
LGFLSKSKKPDELRTMVKAVADPKWKNYSVMIIDLNSDFQMTINESAIFDGASVNKIPILVTLYHLVNEGTIDLNKTITMQARDVQDYGTGSMRYDAPGSVYSIKTLALLMIQKSDNTAAYILANHIIGLSKIQSYIESLGTTQTDMEENTTSNKDIALLFRSMFEGKVTSSPLTAEMIGFLKDTDFEDRLPAQLPENVVVYHKIGTGIGAVHDAGVVEFGKTKYYVGIFTSNITDEERTSEEVAAVSKAIFEFMNN